MKSRFSSVLKTILIAFLIWFASTGIFVVVDNSLGLSKKSEWFPIAFVILPILFAVIYIVRTFVINRPQEVPRKQKPAGKPPARVEAPRPAVQSAAKGGPRTVDEAMAIVDAMEGHDFEQFCAEVLERCGYQNIHVTKGTGDQGVDIIAIKNGVRYAFQCKRYSSKLGNKPVQEVHTGKQFYSCQVGVVITNSYFTKGAEDAARRVGVELWDRDTLIRKMGYRALTAQGVEK